MLTNKLNDTTKVLIIVSTVIIVCVLCAVGFKLVNEGKSSVNASTNSFNSMTSQFSEIDLAIYDGANVMGSEVVNLIKTVVSKDLYMSIEVKTLDDTFMPYNYYCEYDNVKEEYSLNKEKYARKEIITEKITPGYINPMATFKGKIIKDANGSIICINYVQLP